MNSFLLKSNYLIFKIILLFSVSLYSNSKHINKDTILLENDYLKVKIKKKGAEIISLYNKEKSFEHIWQADKKSWNQNAPILFPIVGKLKNGKYFIDNKEYKMKNHGFASFSTFEIISKSKSKVVLSLESNASTLKKYPYKFKLIVKYTLKENKVLIENKVVNIDNKKIYFSIGAHPGFNIPINKKEKYTDYYLEFSQKETVARMPLTKKKGLLSNNYIQKYLDNTHRLQLNHKIFKDRAIILKSLKSSTVEIKSDFTDTSVKIGIENFPFLGIWTTSKSNENFVCIEPWYGVSDSENTQGNFQLKKGIQTLQTSKDFIMKYFIEIKNKK